MGGLSLVKKSGLSAAAAAMVFGAAAPAFAGGGHYRHGYHGYHGHYGHHGHYRRGGGGKGAAIALGVIGGAIILNELAEDRARDRYYQDRYYQDRYYYDQRTQTRAYDQGYYDGRDDQRRAEDYYDDRAYDDGAYGDDSGLAGGGPVYRSPGASDYDRAPRMISESAAYNACLSHARRALAERGFVVSAPYRPETVEDRGGALLMTATVTAERGADMWSRAMSCEASENRVYRMELI